MDEPDLLARLPTAARLATHDFGCAAVPIRTNKLAIAIDFIGSPSFSPLLRKCSLTDTAGAGVGHAHIHSRHKTPSPDLFDHAKDLFVGATHPNE
jgi:hypothetical protein